MVTRRRYPTLVAFGFVGVLLMGPAAVGAQDASATTPFGQWVHNLNPVNWRMPKFPTFRSLLPRQEEQARIRKKQEGLVEEVSKTASGSWQRTKEALNPQRFAPSKLFPASAKTPSTPPDQQRPGFFQSLFGASAPPPGPKDPAGFLKQPRINP